MPPYEVPSRLADRDQQAQVASIVGLKNSNLNNVEPIPEPGERLGAGRVRAFAAPARPLRAPACVEDDGAPSACAHNHIGSSQQNGNTHLNPTGNVNPSQPANTSSQPIVGEVNEAGVNDMEMRGPSRRVAGYGALADFMASDKVFCIFRRFESLSIRNLLFMQDEISELEEQLQLLDKAHLQSGNQAALYSLHSRRYDRNEQRKVIMMTLREKLYRYQKSLGVHSRCVQMEKARDMYVDSVRNWVDGKKPVVEKESHFLDDENDLASLALKVDEYHLFEKWVEKNFSQAFVSKRHRDRPLFGEEVQFYSSTSIRRVVRSALTVLAVVILVGPLFALYYTNKQVVRLFLIAVFSLIFALAISLGTKSRNFEIFAAMAAYAAVLVVFVGNNPAEQKQSM